MHYTYLFKPIYKKDITTFVSFVKRNPFLSGIGLNITNQNNVRLEKKNLWIYRWRNFN